MKKHTLLLLLFIMAGIGSTIAQEQHAFYNDVQTIRKYDQIYQIPAHPILFVGSSSIRKWEHLQQAFGSYNVINRGIGGAVINDITFYVNDLIFPYEPRQIVLYVGENDLPSDTETPDTILARTKVLYNAIRARMPTVPLVYIAMKPSPSRSKYMQKCIAANELVKTFLAGEKNTVFVDIFTPMLKDGQPRKELFVQDMLHMNLQGYSIWEKAVKPYLLKNE